MRTGSTTLRRSGDRVGRRATCYLSADGEEWTPVDQHVLDVDGPVVAGLVVCSHDPGQCSTATFDHGRISPLFPTE